MKTRLICCLICVICCGCISMGDIGIVDTISVSPEGKVALCIDEDVYITDLSGSRFTRITENDVYNGSVSWSKDELLYVENPGDIWTLNLYREGEESIVLLQEMNKISLPFYSEKLSYIVLSEEDEAFGSINIYEMDTSRIYTLIENAYCDYEWVPGTRKIVAIAVTNTNEDNFQGVLLVKDLDSLEEEVIFNGTFTKNFDYVDITTDNNIIFSSSGEIYLYNVETKELSKWQGPEGYDFRLPYSVNSSLKGYVLAKVKGVEEEWEGQLYIVKPGDKLIPIPGWPLWIDEPMIICCMDLDIIIKNLEKNETVNLTEKFDELKKD